MTLQNILFTAGPRAYKSKHDLAVIQPKNEMPEQEIARLKRAG